MQKKAHAMNREIELKYRLHDPDAMERVKQAAFRLNNSDKALILEQTNYFFDTPDFLLKANSYGLRLRHENKEFILSAKGDDPDAGKTSKTMTIRLEYELPISADMAESILKSKRSALDVLCSFEASDVQHEKTKSFLCTKIGDLAKDHTLTLVGSFSNRRICVPIIIGGAELVLELDETRFSPEIIHQEVELEIPETFDYQAAEQFLTTLFEQAHADHFESRGKAERFFELLTRGKI